jgi:hypothetical protein
MSSSVPSPFLRRSRYFVAATKSSLVKNARIFALLEAELLDDLVTTDAAEVITLRIEEQALDERAGVRGRRRIAGTQAAINIFQRLFFVLGRILLHALDDDAVINRGIDHFDFGGAEFGDLLDDRFGERFESARDNDALVGIDGVFDQHLVLDVLEILGFLDGQVFKS